MLHKYTSSPPPAAFVGRMRYAPTLPDNREQKTKNKKGIPIISEFEKQDFSLVWYSFLALMQEKNQKKIKPPTGGEEVWLGTCLEGRMQYAPTVLQE